MFPFPKREMMTLYMKWLFHYDLQMGVICIRHLGFVVFPNLQKTNEIERKAIKTNRHENELKTYRLAT